jgi:hypothetical protein
MKATIAIPDELFRAAKRKALEDGTAVRTILERALRPELKSSERPRLARKIQWVTSPGGLPPGLVLTARAKMREWIEGSRSPDRD